MGKYHNMIYIFRSSLQRGTGEAYLILKKNTQIDFSSEIIPACLKNFAYHPQREGSRAHYLAGLIDLSVNKEKVLNAIEKGLATEKKDTWALDQLFDLAAIYAGRGNEKIRQAIYKRFFKKRIVGSDWCGSSAILELDRFEGLKFIATTIGQYCEKHPTYLVVDDVIQEFQDKNPEMDVRLALKHAGEKNPHIRLYLDRIEKTINNRKEHRSAEFNMEVFQKRIASGKYFFVPEQWIQSLSPADVNVLAVTMMNQRHTIRQEMYLYVFSRIRFPLDYSCLINLMQLKKKSLAAAAAGALVFFKGKDIRQFALTGLLTTQTPWLHTNLLIENYRKGDARILASLADRFTQGHEDMIHILACSYINIFTKNKTKECKRPLQILYNKTTSGIARYNLIKIMIKNNVLPQQIKRELPFDSYEYTRKLKSNN
jgi:hypothetical protein